MPREEGLAMLRYRLGLAETRRGGLFKASSEASLLERSGNVPLSFVPRLRSHTPDSSGKPAGCAAPEDLERIAGLGPKNNRSTQ